MARAVTTRPALASARALRYAARRARAATPPTHPSGRGRCAQTFRVARCTTPPCLTTTTTTTTTTLRRRANARAGARGAPVPPPCRPHALRPRRSLTRRPSDAPRAARARTHPSPRYVTPALLLLLPTIALLRSANVCRAPTLSARRQHSERDRERTCLFVDVIVVLERERHVVRVKHRRPVAAARARRAA